jgi:hypothetical protein
MIDCAVALGTEYNAMKADAVRTSTGISTFLPRIV